MKEVMVPFPNPTEDAIGKEVRWKADALGGKIRRNSVVGKVVSIKENSLICEITNSAYYRMMKDAVTPIFSIGTKNN